jgi:ribosomal protein S10
MKWQPRLKLRGSTRHSTVPAISGPVPPPSRDRRCKTTKTYSASDSHSNSSETQYNYRATRQSTFPPISGPVPPPSRDHQCKLQKEGLGVNPPSQKSFRKLLQHRLALRAIRPNTFLAAHDYPE